MLFVGTKKQAQQAVKETAKECGQFYVTERWLGGTLTNFQTIKRSIARLKEIEKMEADGTINNYVKQEQSVIRREAARLVKYFDGIRAMDKYPGRDVRRGHQARAQRRRRGAPAQDSRRGHRGHQLRSRTWWIIRSPATTTPSARCA